SRCCRHIAKGTADLPQACSVEPAFCDTAHDGPAVGSELTPADVMVAALVIEDEEPDRLGHAVDQARIDDEDTRSRSTLARQSTVEYVPRPTTAQAAACHCDSSVALELGNPARGRRCVTD